ncbi:D-glycero-alpha-D-manno-heptose-1,7-bisphosphate 7-phosphatase [Haliscomenobacter hydrossis]|uniref:D,D-heptose 1,7-bisphosphate phosphatase n=1 Tax=Haliscomenobacter hydrossis (strain ATCC 27775 / DSM 1100 / LMG 10767 / O) TaxID=760192 RepID=F4KX49_HALH1|nr:HAD family hydrolase [Haliscomenobacter hydrossis]AEE48277.1 histidinol-phosphate phosphatase family protein [Haliscomenobacter hydrossis DSM 1100]
MSYNFGATNESLFFQTLFLDRDGVINERLPGDYVAHWEEFQFTPRALEALAFFSTYFHRIVVVTNQQGIGKGKMSVGQLEQIHEKMVSEIQQSGGRIDAVYYCPDLSNTPNNCRKPASGMALMAQNEFPEIDFQQSVMVGDSVSDIEFGQNLGMATVLIEGKMDEIDKLEHALRNGLRIDQCFASLWEFAAELMKTPPR